MSLRKWALSSHSIGSEPVIVNYVFQSKIKVLVSMYLQPLTS